MQTIKEEREPPPSPAAASTSSLLPASVTSETQDDTQISSSHRRADSGDSHEMASSSADSYSNSMATESTSDDGPLSDDSHHSCTSGETFVKYSVRETLPQIILPSLPQHSENNYNAGYQPDPDFVVGDFDDGNQPGPSSSQLNTPDVDSRHSILGSQRSILECIGTPLLPRWLDENRTPHVSDEEDTEESGLEDDDLQTDHVYEAIPADSVPVPNELRPVGQDGLPSAPPPPYQETEVGWRLAYRDFLPKCLNPGGILTKPSFERFDSLMARANAWQQHHPELRVRLCESLHLRPPMVWEGGMLEPHNTVYEYDAPKTCHLRALRVWVSPRAQLNQRNRPEQIGYLNVIPACLKKGSVRSNPVFDTLGETVDKFNQLLHHRPLPGRILNAETLVVRFREWSSHVDPDSCCWHDQGYSSTCYLQVLRIYYTTGASTPQTLGMLDFPPGRTVPGSVFRWEGFDCLVSKASTWLDQNPHVNLTNIETVHCKVRGRRIRPGQSRFAVSPMDNTSWVQGLRLFYVTGSRVTPVWRLPYCPLSHRLFLPQVTGPKSMLVEPQSETMIHMMRRVTAWLEFNPGVPVLCAETVVVNPSEVQTETAPSAQHRSFGYNHTENWAYGIRVYMAGTCRDPVTPVNPPLNPVFNDRQPGVAGTARPCTPTVPTAPALEPTAPDLDMTSEEAASSNQAASTNSCVVM